MTWGAFAARAIGTPFLPGGREFGGWDCWGLVLVGHREVLGAALSPYGDVETANRMAVGRSIRAGASGAEPFVRVETPTQMDVVVMRLPNGRSFGHVGLYDGVGGVLHVEESSATVIERLDSATMRGRVIGFWRHQRT